MIELPDSFLLGLSNLKDEVEPAPDPTRPFEGERGVRTTGVVPMAAYFRFAEYIHMFQHEHPNTLVRMTQKLHPRSREGEITVRWWQRGTEMPRGE